MSESDTSSRKRLNELRVVDLRYHLEKRGLDKNGVKTALVERLAKAIEAEGHNPEEFLFDVQVESTKPVGKVAAVKRASRRSKESGAVDDGYEEEAEEEKQDDPQEVKELNKDEEENQEGIQCNGGKSLQNSRQGDTSEDNTSSSPTRPELNSAVAPLTSEGAKNSSRHDEKTCNNDTAAEGAIDANASLNTPVKKEDQVEDSTASRSSKDSTVKAQNTEDKEQKEVTSTEKSASGITVDNLEAKAGSDKSLTEVTNQKTESTASVVSDAKVSASPSPEVKGTSTTTAGKSACANKKEDIKKDGAKVKVAESSKNLWVSGLSEKTRATDLKALFSKHGRVLGAKIVTNSRTPPYKHLYGFVMMASTEDASACVKHLHHTELHGRLLSVEKTTLEPGSPAKKVETQQGDSTKAVKSAVPVSNEDKEKKEGPEKNNVPPEAQKETDVKCNEGDVQTEEKEPEAAEVTEEDEKKIDEEMEEKTSDEKTPKSADEKEKDKEEADTTKKQEGSEERRKRRRRSRSRERSIRSRHHSREHRRPRRSRSREKYRQLDPYYKGREYGRLHISDRPHSRSYHDRRKHYDYHHRSPERRPSYSKIEQEWEKVRMEKSRLEYDLLKLQREKQQVDRARLEVEKAELRMHAQMVELEKHGALKRPYESRGVKDDYWEERRRIGPESESPGRGNDYGRERGGYAEKRGRFDTRNHVDKPAGRRDGRPIPNDAPFSRGGHHGEGPDRHVRNDWKSGSRNSFGSNERGRSFERPAPWDTSAEHDANKFGPSPGPPPVQWGPIKEKWEGPPPGSWGGMEHPRGPPPAVAHPPPNQPMFGGPGNGMGNRMPGGFQPNRFGMNNIRRF